MKKYLMTGIAAIAMCAAFTSCSHDVDPVSQEDLNKMAAEKVVNNYNQAFIATFGQPAANQDWGFGTASRGLTRVAATESNQWFDGVTEKFKHLVQPADVTAREEEVVSEWFKTHKNPICDEIYLTEFFVQQVYFGTEEYHSTDNNGYATSVVGGQHMDWLYAWDPVGTEKTVWVRDEPESQTNYNGHNVTIIDHKDHINNFNTSDPKRTDTGLHNMQLMQNSSTETFGFHESYNTQNDRYYDVKNKNWVIKAISVDGVVGYYVGFDYESHGDRGDFEPNGYFDDRIIKIVPGNGFIPSEYDIRVIAEDLNAASTTDKENSDWDFNDVVFDVKYLDTPVDGKNVKIRVVAAGGTYPLYVGGQEVHALFGQNTDVMINTNAAAYGKHYETTDLPIFYIYDADAKSTNGKSIKVEVDMGNGRIEMTAEVGKPAAKIGVSPNFNYCLERVDITAQYPLFQSWVRTSEPYGWWNNNITGN